VFIWYIFSGFGVMYQEKSGNPAHFFLQRFTARGQDEQIGRIHIPRSRAFLNFLNFSKAGRKIGLLFHIRKQYVLNLTKYELGCTLCDLGGGTTQAIFSLKKLGSMFC
jgi:hypothetical protein